MFRLVPLLALGLGACVLILDPLPGGDDTGGDDTGDTGEPTCAGTVTFLPDAGEPEDVTTAFAAGTAAVPVDWDLQEPGTLLICEGTWFARITVSADVATLEGVGDAVLSGGDAWRIVHFTGTDGLVIRDLALVDGFGDNGGAVLAASGDLEIEGGTLRDNEATNRGGAIYAPTGSIEVSGSTLSDNEAGGFGGAIWAGDELTVTDSHFEGNTCVDSSSCSGGAIFLESSAEPAAISGTTFVDNEARNGGGALFVLGRTVTITDGSFTGNRVELFVGGAVDATSSTLELVRPLFEDNSATDGGALYLSDSSVVCTGISGERAGFFRNDAAVRLVSPGAAEVVSDTCDWGEPGADENLVYDVRVGTTAPADFRFGDDASFTCSGVTCE